VLDKWILALLQKTANEVTEHLESYEITEAGRKLAEFITELSTWYVRRSRDRFKRGGVEAGQARTTLGYVLRQLAILLAPFTPFVAEEVYQRIKGGLESVHLEEWPLKRTAGVDALGQAEQNQLATHNQQLLDEMLKARQEVEVALAQRAAAGIKVRQVLSSFMTTVSFDESIRAIIADEINVKEVVQGKETKLDTALNEALKTEGLVREFTRQVNALRKELKLTINDRAKLIVCAPESLTVALQKQLDGVKQAIIADSIEFSGEPQEHKLNLGEIKASVSIKT
ncbi:MAG TPA: class I tRNA ligase family protein, partial [Patescibacteria group bacterium]|nr:class I tRNA ligase family protein [Patescibacteria group bacterium]